MTINWPSRNGLTGRVRARSAGVLAALLFLIVSCSYGVQFVDTSGHRIYGDYTPRGERISITLPSGESFTGNCFALDRSELSAKQGSLFGRTDVSTYLGLTDPAKGWRDLHAFLKGDRGTTMEAILRYNGSVPTGYGVARTDKGDEYRVELGANLRSPAGPPVRKSPRMPPSLLY